MRTPFQNALADFIEEYPMYVNYLSTLLESSPSVLVNWTHESIPENKQALILSHIEEIVKSVNP